MELYQELSILKITTLMTTLVTQFKFQKICLYRFALGATTLTVILYKAGAYDYFIIYANILLQLFFFKFSFII